MADGDDDVKALKQEVQLLRSVLQIGAWSCSHSHPLLLDQGAVGSVPPWSSTPMEMCPKAALGCCAPTLSIELPPPLPLGPAIMFVHTALA